jgi:hypothetical protein
MEFPVLAAVVTTNAKNKLMMEQTVTPGGSGGVRRLP